MRQDGEPHNNLKIIATTEEKLGERMKGNTLLQLQKRCENIVAVIIDEYSMVPGAHISQVDERLQQGFKNDNPFGGIPIALCGDPGQLPPVIGLSLWVKRPKSGIPITGLALKGYNLSRSISNVMKLTEVLRQGGYFMELLLRISTTCSPISTNAYVLYSTYLYVLESSFNVQRHGLQH